MCLNFIQRQDVAEIVLGDIDIDLANKVKEKIKSDNVTTVKVDAGKIEHLQRATKGADVVVKVFMN